MDPRPLLAIALTACAAAPINADRLDRALPPASWELSLDGRPITQSSVRGTAATHRSIAGEGRVRELAVALTPGGVSEPRVRLRYSLPEGRALPVALGSEVTILVRPPTAAATALLIVEDERGLRAAVAEGSALQGDSLPGGTAVAPAPQVSYRESRRVAGYCEATVEHRAALFTSPLGSRVTLHAGERRQVELDDLNGELLLLDHAAAVSTGCADVPLNRFAYVLLAAP